MGYWAAGHLLLAEPDIDALNALPDGLNWTLYKAKASALWLLDIYQTPPDKHGPFSEYIWRGGDIEELEKLIPGYAPITRILASSKLDISITRWLLLSCQLSHVLRQRVFSFVSDDDITQMTTVSDSGGIVRLHCDYEALDLVWEQGRFLITPQLSEEDPDFEPDEKLLAKLSAVAGVVVQEVRTIPGGGRPIHDIVIQDWPEGAGDPRQLVDLGSGDDFLDLDSRFSVVASRTVSSLPKAKTPSPSPSVAPHPAPAKRGFWQRLFGK